MKPILFWIVLSTLLLSCEHKDLYQIAADDKILRLAFDWSQVDPTDIPKSVRVVLSPSAELPNSQDWEFVLPPQGGELRLPDGDYEVMAYNDNSGTNEIEPLYLPAFPYNENRDWRWVMHTPKVARFPGKHYAPDCFCLAEKAVRVNDSTRQTILWLQPTRRTARVTYQVTGIRGVNKAARVYGILTNCTAHLDLATGICLERLKEGLATDLCFEMTTRGEVLEGSFYLLGGGFPPDLCTTPAHQHHLWVWMEDSNGTMWKVSGEVTDQVPCLQPIAHPLPDFHLKLDLSVNFPEISGDEAGGFSPDVDDWESEETEIPLH